MVKLKDLRENLAARLISKVTKHTTPAPQPGHNKPKFLNKMKKSLGEDNEPPANTQHVGTGKSKDMQMAVDAAKQNARVSYLRSQHGDNFQDKAMPDHSFGKLDIQNDNGSYSVKAPLIINK